MQRLVMPPHAGSNPVSHPDESSSGIQISLLFLILDQWFLMELRPMAGQLSDAQPMWVRFPQLRSCFSGAMEAQLFRNQQAVGSNPTGSSHIYVPVG